MWKQTTQRHTAKASRAPLKLLDRNVYEYLELLFLTEFRDAAERLRGIARPFTRRRSVEVLVVLPIFGVIAIVRALALPVGFTVVPESNVPAVALGANGAVAAIAQSTDRTFRVRVVRWNEAGERQVFSGLNVLTAPGGRSNAVGNQDPNYEVDAADVVSAGQALLVTASTRWSGAYSGISYEVQRWGRYSAARWPLPACVDSGDSVDQHAYGGDLDGRVALTIDRTGAGSFQVLRDDYEKYAPYAYIVRSSDCRSLGRGVVQSVRGQWAAGFRSFLDGKIAPDNLDPDSQTAIAARWYGEYLRELGPGDALAINAVGFTVGADAVPARVGCTTPNFYGGGDRAGQAYCFGVPHAVGWDRTARRIALAPRSPRSVAYGIADNGTAVGMLTDASGRHFAFRWRNGVLQRLDDLPHPSGWRFESAYAIGSDGSIAGIGTLDGVATVFVWRE